MSQDKTKPSIIPRARLLSQSAFTTSLHDRPLLHNAKHSIHTSDRRDLRFDEGSLQMANDPNSSFYRRLSETLEKRGSITTLPTEEEEKLKLLAKYGPELVEFMKDRDGRLKSKFDKAFIT